MQIFNLRYEYQFMVHALSNFADMFPIQYTYNHIEIKKTIDATDWRVIKIGKGGKTINKNLLYNDITNKTDVGTLINPRPP